MAVWSEVRLCRDGFARQNGLQAPQALCVNEIGERHGSIAVQTEVAVPFLVEDLRGKRLLDHIGSYDGVQATVGQIWRPGKEDLADLLRKPHAALHAQFPDPGRLEARFDQPRCRYGRQFRGMMIGRQAFREQAYNLLSIPPCFFKNLVSGSVEIDAIDIGCSDATATWL